MKTIAVIPAYNEQVLIIDVVNRTKVYCDEIVVVDDGSTDNTQYVVKRLGVKYIIEDRNYGAGHATKNGIKMALSNNADVVITLDGDGQHDPDEIPKLLKPIMSNEADIVIGSRFIEPLGFNKLKEMKMIKVPRYRMFGIKVITWFYNFGHRKKIEDGQCCFRAFNKKALDLISIKDDGFGFATEVLIKARKLGLRMVEVPITCVYHADINLNSTVNPVKHGLIAVSKTLFWRIRCMS